MPHARRSPATKSLRMFIPLVALLALVPLGCDGLTGADAACLGDAPGGACTEALQGIPPLPPPPCWNEAGEIQSDEVCAKVHEERMAEESGDDTRDEDEATLPAPPALPH